MTLLTEAQREHCEHECVCFLIPEIEERIPEEVCSVSNCEHDTRSAAIAEHEGNTSPETKQAYRNGYDDGFVEGQSSVQCDLNLIERRVRKEALDPIINWIKKHRENNPDLSSYELLALLSFVEKLRRGEHQ